MRALTATFLTLTLLLFSAKEGLSADFRKGLDAYNRGDYATALLEWKPLAEQGLAEAQHHIGFLYDDGQGVPENDKTAVKWYTLAAEQGYAAAQTNLGVMYSTGQGVVQDIVYAYLWVSMAAANGNELGEKLKGAFARILTPSQTVEVQRLARECIEKNYKNC